MVLLASRNQLCIHEELKEFKGTELNKRCMQKYKNQKCHLYNNLDDFLKSGGNNDLARLVKDVEDFDFNGRFSSNLSILLLKENRCRRRNDSYALQR
eukprot:UN13303